MELFVLVEQRDRESGAKLLPTGKIPVRGKFIDATDGVYRRGVEWIAANAYRLDQSAYEVADSEPVQMLAELTDVDPMWIVQCVDRCARNRAY